jgi:hypothetical protein
MNQTHNQLNRAAAHRHVTALSILKLRLGSTSRSENVVDEKSAFQRGAFQRGAFQRGAFQSDAFQVGGLFVELDGQAAAMYGARFEAMDLAEKVLTHWEADPRLC